MHDISHLFDGVTKRERHHVTMEMEDAIKGAGGWIEDENLLSNKAVVLRFFMPHYGFKLLRDAIKAADVRLDDESAARLEAVISNKPASSEEIAASLTITFSHNEPDLKREIPAVPG